MVTMKSYTDLAQSKVLAKILPLESADMFYYKDAVTKEDNPRVMDYSQVPKNKSMYYFPCWSLAALLNILPFPQLSKDKLGNGNVGWMVSAYPYDCRYDSCWHDNQIDACYEMILKLHERKML